MPNDVMRIRSQGSFEPAASGSVRLVPAHRMDEPIAVAVSLEALEAKLAKSRDRGPESISRGHLRDTLVRPSGLNEGALGHGVGALARSRHEGEVVGGRRGDGRSELQLLALVDLPRTVTDARAALNAFQGRETELRAFARALWGMGTLRQGDVLAAIPLLDLATSDADAVRAS